MDNELELLKEEYSVAIGDNRLLTSHNEALAKANRKLLTTLSNMRDARGAYRALIAIAFLLGLVVGATTYSASVTGVL